MTRLTSSNETIFTKGLDTWYEIYKDLLSEKTFNESTGKERFSHAKLISTYKSLRSNLPYLYYLQKVQKFKHSYILQILWMVDDYLIRENEK